MSSLISHAEREEEAIMAELDRGEITQKEADKAIRRLHRECREYAMDAAKAAYDHALD